MDQNFSEFTEGNYADILRGEFKKLQDFDDADVRHIIALMRKSCLEKNATRWIWELIQNACDAKLGDELLNITLSYTPHRLEFKHDGRSFEPNELIALIVQRTSKKQLDDYNRYIGQFGFGLITTQVLNLSMTIVGVFKHNDIKRNFRIKIDRSGLRNFFRPKTVTTRSTSQQTDANVRLVVTNVHENGTELELIASRDVHFAPSTTLFRFDIEDKLARHNLYAGINSLKENLLFCMIINEKSIETVKINEEGFKIENICLSRISDVKFTTLVRDGQGPDPIAPIHGILHINRNNVTVGLPITFMIAGEIGFREEFRVDAPKITPKFFRYFPLQGMETFEFPFLCHSKYFSIGAQSNSFMITGDHSFGSDINKGVMLQYLELVKELSSKVSEHLGFPMFGCPENVDEIDGHCYDSLRNLTRVGTFSCENFTVSGNAWFQSKIIEPLQAHFKPPPQNHFQACSMQPTFLRF